LTWEETVRRDLKEWNIPNDLSLNRSAWKAAIHVPKPRIMVLLGFKSSIPQLTWD